MMKAVAIFLAAFFWFVRPVGVLAATISNVSVVTTAPKVFEKYELRFDLVTPARYPFFEYDSAPPVGVTAGTGVTAYATFTNSATGKTYRQPAFYTTEVTQNGMVFTETNKKYWVVRFSPPELGNYSVILTATDASGTGTYSNIPSFSPAAPTRHGFIKVSSSDPRYFEFSDGTLFWPIGPAWGTNYSQYAGTGQNFERPWMGGSGAYSTNWARWKSSAEQHGNEGYKARLNWREHAPGRELSYEIFYSATAPNGFRIWLAKWNDDMFFTPVKPNTTYQVKLTYKAVNIAGPRNASYPYGFVIKPHRGVNDWIGLNDDIETILRGTPSLINGGQPLSNSNGWQTIQTTVTTGGQSGGDISLYLDNVTGGQVYIDEFSLKDASGAEIVRNPVADLHTYVDPRAAAFFDWQVNQGEQYGVFFKYVVHDKNDWIQNHLLSTGQWADTGNGYFQGNNTKAAWLLRQWYRYLAARWGYSTAIHSWEQVNEADPNDSAVRSTANTFAGYMHTFGGNPHLATTSFWCCSLVDGLQTWNSSTYPNIDYADLHEYSGAGGNTVSTDYTNDVAAWVVAMSTAVRNKLTGSLSKPLIWAENGLMVSGTWTPLPNLKTANAGVWYHNLLWSQLHNGAVSAPNYWWSEHMQYINRSAISTPFNNFVSALDLNKGGYVDVAATSSNSKLRVIGQKNLARNKAHLWVQNSDHTWRNVLTQFGANDGDVSLQSGTVTLTLNPNTTYTVETWNTVSGTKTTASQTSGATGALVLSITNLGKDVAFQIYSGTQVTPTPTSTTIPALTLGNGDSNGDGVINFLDIRAVISAWVNTAPSGLLNQYGDSKLNAFDFAVVAYRLRNLPVPTPTPTLSPTPTPVLSPTPTLTPGPTPGPTSGEWTQDAHDAQRTGYTPTEPNTPWTFVWSFNGPDANGGTGSHLYDAPKEARTVMGGGKIYVPAGSRGLYALNKDTGVQVWNVAGTFNAAVVYDPASGSVLAGGADGKLYKIDSVGGATSYNAGSPINKAVLVVGQYAYVVTDSGQLHKVKIADLSQVWVYSSGSSVAVPPGFAQGSTPPSYSASRDVIVFATADLNVHAVSNSNGTAKWKVKPTPASNPASCPDLPACAFTFNWGWPVVADGHGIVFLRMGVPNLNGGGYLTDYPGGKYPNTMAEIRTYLQNTPDHQTLFALNLDDGTKKFIPAVGPGSTEDRARGVANGVMPSMPVVKTFSDGTEVAYIHFRNGQGTATDFRGDSHMGEMVLDDTTISGLAAGDLRFVKMNRDGSQGGNSYTFITDEQTPVVVAGDTVINAHWAASTSVRITDRTSAVGLNYSNPIKTTNLSPVMRAMKACGTLNATHSTTCGLSYVTDGGRYLDGPGFWVYWNVADPPGWHVGSGNTAGTSYSAGILPRYTYVSGGYMVVEGNGGDIFVLRHN